MDVDVDYVASARVELSVTYIYTSASGVMALEDGPQRRASSPLTSAQLDAIKSQSVLA